MPRNPRPDAFPQQQQRRELALIFGPDERTAQLERWPQLPDEARIEAEQRLGIKPLQSEPRHQSGNIAEPVCADNLALLFIPEKQVQVMRIEPIQIERLACPFPCRAKCDFAQTPDLLKRERNTGARRPGRPRTRGSLRAGTRGQRLDLIGQRVSRNRRGHGMLIWTRLARVTSPRASNSTRRRR